MFSSPRLKGWTGLSIAAAVLLVPALGVASIGEFHNVFDPWLEFSRILNFLIVVLALYFILRKPLRMLMAKRREGIQNAIKEAEEARAEAKRLREDYERRTAELGKELEAMKAQTKSDQEALRVRLLKEGTESAERVLDHARLTIDQETKKAEQQLRSKAALLALELAEKALKRELGPEDQRRFLQDYIHKVGEMN
jgi:F-type H+-transporting ATPase subunit b